MPHIDWTISAGNLIAFGSVIIGCYIALSNRMKAMETKVDAIWEWFIQQMPQIAPAGRRTADGVLLRIREHTRSRRTSMLNLQGQDQDEGEDLDPD